ncbi:hypothetical protein GCM10009416_42000 [Craurococcus roseus]|uniref:Uncharacterized protein n=1 Tax=Craurococcus roseus TaxID=77585 RepID=A0ABN1FXI4_9PROT
MSRRSAANPGSSAAAASRMRSAGSFASKCPDIPDLAPPWCGEDRGRARGWQAPGGATFRGRLARRRVPVPYGRKTRKTGREMSGGLSRRAAPTAPVAVVSRSVAARDRFAEPGGRAGTLPPEARTVSVRSGAERRGLLVRASGAPVGWRIS